MKFSDWQIENGFKETSELEIEVDAEYTLALLKQVHITLRTFRNVPEDKHYWGSLDDDVMSEVEKAIRKLEGEVTG